MSTSIEIAANAGSQHGVIVVEATKLLHGLCVHRGIGHERGRWVVTHIPTGYRVNFMKTKLRSTLRRHADAVTCMGWLARFGNWDDWDSGEAVPQAVRKRIRRHLVAHRRSERPTLVG